ncbi:unnamed protein product [Allacma fusca]|uniref:Uncharacterized protein n=1 Tax=Allacma fusca TaxID=39272 RepID=A0A8J2KF61_9HEXA|nr:unnamed protein product [Allacma fusca]
MRLLSIVTKTVLWDCGIDFDLTELHACVEGYWLPQGDVPVIQPDKCSPPQLPILIQGETSVGKTSLSQYLDRVWEQMLQDH